MTQAERDKLEEERIDRARRQREALLSGASQQEMVRCGTYIRFTVNADVRGWSLLRRSAIA